jgi:hypothetical protein
MGKDRKPLGTLAVVAFAALLLSAVALTGPTLAGKPGTADAGGPTLSVSPNRVPFGATSIVISGSGFRSNQTLDVGVAGGIPSYRLATDGNGSFSLTYTPGSGSFSTASPYNAFAGKFKGHTMVILAMAPFTVCSTNPCQ